MSTKLRLTRDEVAELERYAAAARALEGWELEHAPERLGPEPPWDYERLAGELCAQARTILDLGTGGGEVFSRALAGSSGHAVSTECWHVNAPVAARRLAGRAHVVRASSLTLPFASARFDLVLSRHEEICPHEVARVLAPGGRLLTQQVIPEHWQELRELFPDMTRFPDHYREYQQELERAGLKLEDAQRLRCDVRFRALGPLVYHLVACPWLVPSFNVTSPACLEALAQLSQQAGSEQGIVLTDGLYLLQARAAS